MTPINHASLRMYWFMHSFVVVAVVNLTSADMQIH